MASALNTLRELAQQDVDQATRALGHARQACQQAQQQLEMLLNYQDEYRQRLNRGMNGGIAAASWYNYQQFILTLEQAIEQHRGQLAQCRTRLESATHSWQQKHQRLNAFSTLHERAEAQRQSILNKQDQKRMDEYAQRASLRREKS